MAERKTKAQEQAASATEDVGAQSVTALEPDPPTEPTPDGAQSAAAPLEPPKTARELQQEPMLGHSDSTTNHLAANAALRSVSGSVHEGLVDEAGNLLDIDDVFTFPDPGNPRTVATVRQRVYERFYYPNTSQPATQLLYPAGAEVPTWQARKVIDKYREIQPS